MAKLYFYYSAMNAGKSTLLLQSSYNYRERGMKTFLFTPKIDNRFGENKISSRIGLQEEAFSFDHQLNLFEHIEKEIINNPIQCVLLDEAQFLTKQQVMQLAMIVDRLNIPVLAYGIRSDFQGEPFEGSQYLLVWADNLVEVKTICFCGKKAIMNARLDEKGNIIRTGEQIHIGNNDKYVSMCRRHFNEALLG